MRTRQPVIIAIMLMLVRVSRGAFKLMDSRALLPRHAVSRASHVRLGAPNPGGRRPYGQFASSDNSPALRNFCQRVLRETTLSEVFEANDVQLYRKDGRVLAQCPFHKGGKERNPSMKVDDTKGTYYCFTCKEHGNAISFLEASQGLRYGEAVRELARSFDIEGAEELDGALGRMEDAQWQPPQLTASEQTLVDANEAASRYYLAVRRTPAATECAELLRRRGITNQIAERFSLGYAPDTWESLSSHLRTATNLTDSTVVSAGLCKPRTGGGRGDRIDVFRNRLMIPIHDPHGRVVALGGRSIAADEQGPKYLNSAESDIFKKQRLVYGMHLARGAIRKGGRALIVEGYLDVVALHAASVPYAVGSLGTALNEAQIELAVKPIDLNFGGGVASRQVVLALDSDDAGQGATEKLYTSGAFRRLAAKGIDVRVAVLPSPYGDPDEYILETRKALEAQPLYARGGPDAKAAVLARAGKDFESAVVDRALSWPEWVGRRLAQPYLDAGRATGMLAKTEQDLVGVLHQIPIATVREVHVSLFAGLLAGGDESLKQRLVEALRERLTRTSAPPPLGSASVPPQRVVASSPAAAPAVAPAVAPLALTQLDSLGVDLSQLYVWSGAPTRLHWVAGSSCAMPGLKPRSPRVGEVALPLCEICLKRSNQAAVDPSAPSDARAGAPSDDLQLSSQLEPVERVLLHTLLQSGLKLRQQARDMCEEHGVAISTEVGGLDGGVQLSTEARCAMLGTLLDPPNDLKAKIVWEEFHETTPNATGAGDAMLMKLERRSDSINFEAATLLSLSREPSAEPQMDASRELVSWCIETIAARAPYRPDAPLSRAVEALVEAISAVEQTALGPTAGAPEILGGVNQAAAELQRALTAARARNLSRLSDEDGA